MKQILRPIFMLAILSTWTTVLHSEVHIHITQGLRSDRSIGVVPFRWEGSGNAPEDISGIVASDLRNSGRFKPINYSFLPHHPSIVREIQPTIWLSLGIDLIVVGQVVPELDSNYRITYRLVSINKKNSIVIMQNSYKTNKQWLRYVSHTISDEIFEKLTDIKGAFCTRIAYITKIKDKSLPYELRVSDYDGYNQFTIYRSSQPLMSPSWSPDGSKLAYVTFENGHSELVIQTLSNGLVHKVTSFPLHNGAPAFSPDGSKLAFALSKTGNSNIYVMDIRSGQINQVTYSNNSNNTEPSWFPDNQNLAFTSDQTGYPQVYKVNIKDGIPKRITWEGLQNQNANISADGKIMVMVNTENGQQHIAKQNLLTGKVQILSSTFLDETPSLAPNGTMVIYSSSVDKKSVLNLVSIDGCFKDRILAVEEQVKSPAWSPYL